MPHAAPFLTLALLTTALVALAPTAAGSGDHCPTYEVYVGDPSTGVGVSPDEGALMVAAANHYVFSDGAPILNPWLLNVWIIEESNGIPGPQRGDESCDQTQGGQIEPDCGWACTF